MRGKEVKCQKKNHRNTAYVIANCLFKFLMPHLQERNSPKSHVYILELQSYINIISVYMCRYRHKNGITKK